MKVRGQPPPGLPEHWLPKRLQSAGNVFRHALQSLSFAGAGGRMDKMFSTRADTTDDPPKHEGS
jgi:hypothetical protein